MVIHLIRIYQEALRRGLVLLFKNIEVAFVILMKCNKVQTKMILLWDQNTHMRDTV